MSNRLTPARIALLYAAFAALWIVSSGYLLALVSDPLFQRRLEIGKGLAFVIVTSVLLYLLLKRWRGSLLAEKAKTDTLLRQFFDLPFIGMSITSPSTKRWIQFNGYLCTMLGYSREELIEKNWAELTHPEDIAANIAAFERVMCGESEGFVTDKRFIRKDGVVVFATVDVKCVRKSDGTVDYFVTTIQDITARRQAEEALIESREILRMVIDNALDAVISMDVDGRVLEWSAEAARIFGYQREEAIGKMLGDLIIPLPLRDIHSKGLQRLLATNESHIIGKRIEINGLRRDGSEFPLELSIAQIHRGGTVFFSAFLRDITERKQVEQALLESESSYRSLFDNMLNGVAHDRMIFQDGIPVDYEFIKVNRSFEKMSGLTGVAGRKISEIIPGYCRDNPESLEVFGRVAQTGEPARWEHYLAALGKWFSFSIYSPAPSEFVVVSDDITERKQAEAALAEREEIYRSIVTQASDGIILVDSDTKLIVEFNDAACQSLGYSREEFTGLTIRDIQGEMDVDAIDERMRVMLKKGAYDFETLHRHKNGSLRNVRVSNRIIQLHGRAYAAGIWTDITERKKAEAQLQLAAKVFEQSSEGFIITDAGGDIIMVNHAFTAITGYSEAEVLGKNPRFLASGRHDQEFYRDMWQDINTMGYWHGEVWNRRKDGNLYPERLSINRALDEEGKVTQYIGIFGDITQYKQAEEHIQRLAHFDLLTGLPNRALLADRFNYALNIAQRNNEQLALICIDLDHFKNVNEALGQRIGDELLIEVTKRLKAVVRDEDTVSRQGGDEFILVLPGADVNDATHVAEKLLAVIAQHFQIEQHELVVTPSIGIAIYPGDGRDFETLSKCADTAMYRAKADGRNNYRFFTPGMQARSARSLQLGNALRRALERGELFLHYQPQVSLQDGRIIGAEALLRWQHPEMGMVSPAEFIPVAESSGQILQIGEWVLRTAVQQLKTWMDSGLEPMVMAVNLSAVQFRHASLPKLVTQILEETKLPPQYLELELTEGVTMDDPLAAIAVIDDLHERGIRMSIDDFGTGYSSLSYLKKFKVYKLKIDQSFVRDISEDPEDKAIVSAIINMASSLGMQTIAEGVETAAQLAFLRLQGCDEVQGYYFSKPLPAGQFEAFVRGKG
jgi:diguanylate cyclase (GGDEF)-like protein/PAS domain S-box-containing protein